MKKQDIFYKNYNIAHKKYARKMRANGTSAEKRMRENVLMHRPLGYKFLRQKPIGPFIVDFYCSKLSIVIELDGKIHQKTQEYDLQRDTRLYKKGISVVRYKNEEMTVNRDDAKKEVERLIDQRKQEIENAKNPLDKGE